MCVCLVCAFGFCVGAERSPIPIFFPFRPLHHPRSLPHSTPPLWHHPNSLAKGTGGCAIEPAALRLAIPLTRKCKGRKLFGPTRVMGPVLLPQPAAQTPPFPNKLLLLIITARLMTRVDRRISMLPSPRHGKINWLGRPSMGEARLGRGQSPRCLTNPAPHFSSPTPNNSHTQAPPSSLHEATLTPKGTMGTADNGPYCRVCQSPGSRLILTWGAADPIRASLQHEDADGLGELDGGGVGGVGGVGGARLRLPLSRGLPGRAARRRGAGGAPHPPVAHPRAPRTGTHGPHVARDRLGDIGV